MEDPGEAIPISVRSFVAARAEEIVALSLQIGASSSVTNKGLAFQHVPKHMRRRAVSHNVKRLPKRLQLFHLNQLGKSGCETPPKKPKKPSRKHRRRKSNLLLEYNRRQRSVSWLETHVWHAKRFHMESKWGYRIPVAPCDKGYRALYRAFSQHAAMRDLSFLSCLDLTGPAQVICDGLKAFCSPLANRLSVGALFYTSGEREGSLHFYSRDSYPRGYIGQVKFIWTSSTSLWLWVHPRSKAEVLDQLTESFELDPEITFTKNTVGSSTSMSIDQIKLSPKKLEKRPMWTNSTSGLILTDLEGSLNRIRLYGPKVTAVLQEVLQLKNDLGQSGGSRWFQEYYGTDERKAGLLSQDKLWSRVAGFSDFPAHSVMPLTVRDPRVFLPQKRAKVGSTGGREMNDTFPELLENHLRVNLPSPLYDPNWRVKVTSEKMTDLEFSRRRGQLLIPGSELELGEDENQVPVLLIQQPEAGWDLILPAGWAMPFWIAFSYRCVRVFGHRDAVHHSFEFGSVHSPDLLAPDTVSGQEEALAEAAVTRQAYFGLPPDKRQNLIQLKCPFPFDIDWPVLLQYWADRVGLPTESPFYVLRDLSLLRKLTQLKKGHVDADLATFDRPEACLVGVRLTILGKGKPEPNSLICIPDESDLPEVKLKGQKSVSVPELSYSEPPKDFRTVDSIKAQLRQRHQKHMAFLRKKRKKLRKRGDEAQDLPLYDSTEQSQAYNEGIQALSLPTSLEALKEQSRVPLGVLTIGGDCYSIGKCAGLGFVTLRGLLELSQAGTLKKLVLVRDSKNTLVYRLARLKVSLPT